MFPESTLIELRNIYKKVSFQTLNKALSLFLIEQIPQSKRD